MKKYLELLDGRLLQFHSPRQEDVVAESILEKLPQGILEKFPEGIEVEIGPGKGEFLKARAAQFPRRFFVGIDRRLDRVHLTSKKLVRNEGPQNFLILHHDARCFLKAGLPPIEHMHVYQPDPWPKKKHHKHRFFRSPEARIWVEAIKSGGTLRVSTDHRGYFEEIVDILMSYQNLRLECAYEKTASLGDPWTHFEGIFLRQKLPVWKSFWRKL